MTSTKRIERLRYHRFVSQWKTSNKRKMKQDELFDHSMPDRCSAHKGVIAFRRHGSTGQNGAALLLSNTLLAYLFYCSYLLGDKSCRGEAADHKKPWPGPPGAGRSVTPTFSCSSLCVGMFFHLSSVRTRDYYIYIYIIINAVSTSKQIVSSKIVWMNCWEYSYNTIAYLSLLFLSSCNSLTNLTLK